MEGCQYAFAPPTLPRPLPQRLLREGGHRSFAPTSPLLRPLPQRLLREGGTVLSLPPPSSPVLSRSAYCVRGAAVLLPPSSPFLSRSAGEEGG